MRLFKTLRIPVAASLASMGTLMVANLLLALLPTQATATALSFNGDAYTNGQKIVCICGGANCEPCGNVS